MDENSNTSMDIFKELESVPIESLKNQKKIKDLVTNIICDAFINFSVETLRADILKDAESIEERKFLGSMLETITEKDIEAIKRRSLKFKDSIIKTMAERFVVEPKEEKKSEILVEELVNTDLDKRVLSLSKEITEIILDIHKTKVRIEDYEANETDIIANSMTLATRNYSKGFIADQHALIMEDGKKFRRQLKNAFTAKLAEQITQIHKECSELLTEMEEKWDKELTREEEWDDMIDIDIRNDNTLWKC